MRIFDLHKKLEKKIVEICVIRLCDSMQCSDQDEPKLLLFNTDRIHDLINILELEQMPD